MMGGRPALLTWLKANGGFHVADQWKAVSAELTRRGVPSLGRRKIAAAIDALPSTAPAAVGPTIAPAVRLAPQIAASAPATEGRLDLATACEKTLSVFGHAPAVIPGQNERSQWAELTAMYLNYGHGCPWTEATSPDALVIGIHKSDGAWRKRESAIQKLFHGAQPTTARITERKPEVAKPLTGRARAVAAWKNLPK